MEPTRHPYGPDKAPPPAARTSGPQPSQGVEDLVTDDDRLTFATEFTSEACDESRSNVGVSPPNAEAACPDWEHLGG